MERCEVEQLHRTGTVNAGRRNEFDEQAARRQIGSTTSAASSFNFSAFLRKTISD